MAIEKRKLQSSKQSQQSKRQKRRFKEIAREAAARTLNGNGASPSLPPLPKADQEGLGTLFSHPYGALPYGNIFMAQSDAVRENGLGNLKCMNDEQIISIFQFLDGKSLANVVQASRFAYVAGHHDELWRDLVLRYFGKVGFDFQKCWRDTFVHSTLKTNGKLEMFQNHVPISIKGIYSDTFFRSWLCRSFALQESWLSVNNVITEDAENLSLDRFLSEYEEKNIPLIVRGATKSWRASQKWNKEYLCQQTRDMTFRATSGAAPLPAQFSMASYAQYCESATEEAPLYLFDRTFAQKCPTLLNDFLGDLKSFCPYFDDEAEHGHDLFSLLGKGKRPDHRWIIIGPKRSGSSFHIDPNATHAWNAPIRGRKRWIFYPPGVPPPGVYPSPNGDDVVMPISLGEWYLSHWNDHVKQRNNPDVSKRPLECTVNEGDILFVPHGWWHCVLNLDDGMSIALTQNYVSASNLPDVLRFLKTKPQQISGCRDRREATQPDELLDKFVEKLKEKRPALLKEATLESEKGWQCEAWTDDVDESNEENENDGKEVKSKGISVLEKAKMFEEKDGENKASPTQSSGFTFSFM
ncbi:hypothetical protein CTEN210_11832 [Chaetoceros tenuissimus]|uniref:JmjC domain-containing protein n=1 Tax=Chaetoceros tenuissimus TaxID=426638 RepID=A0AAD3D209_9STRA|nr:hypothetical protein CTEN210_11832 [Chaetoceros tenuissimus]